MYDGKLLPSISTGYSYREIVRNLIGILKYVQMETMLKTNILTTLQKMDNDVSYFFNMGAGPIENETYLDPYYDAFDALKEISNNRL